MGLICRFFIDGDSDWMDPQGGVQSIEKLRAAGNKQGKLYIVKNAGHHRKFSFFDVFLPSNMFNSISGQCQSRQ